MRKKPGPRIKKGKTMTSAGIILIALLILILIAATSTGLFSSSLVMQNPFLTKDVQTAVSVSRDDVVIFISGGNDVADLREIIICINGVQLTEDQARQHIYSNTCTFRGVVEGVSGSRDISIKGVFSDGVTTTLRCCKIECT
ncbi:MAG: hypothetical protein Q7J08_04615 [Methanocorpusculum sp.]|uniref:hypothetical protein n=1 Tax=Methanocorpusculum sp. TaxID=2058474 RepID=UPI00272054F1|nr:hypothetical protein [Methanocorpusculum sp.]MDO9522979.1 hypothetical protein [Methanocorpusculum sp.]